MRGACWDLVVVAIIAALAGMSCAEPGPEGPGVGDACDEDGACAPGLDCVHLICADDSGPEAMLTHPEHLQDWDPGPSSLIIGASALDTIDGDQLELALDPGLGGPAPEIVALEDGNASVTLELGAPLAVGPHHVRVRVVDADGQPYPNPSARDEVVIFVRDPDDPTTPQVALAWPPAGHELRVGNPLELEVAVLPGSFAFVQSGDNCQPLPDCEPIFDPTCEATCGPVSREGHAKLFTLDDYPGCLLDEPISCNGDYIQSMRPGASADLLDDNQLRSTVPGDRFSEPGPQNLHVALSYDYHEPFPSAAAVIHETIPVTLIE